MKDITNIKDRERKGKINVLLFISIILLFISMVNVDALIIGKDGNFKGRIDKVRIYNRALSEGEVKECYNSNFYKYYPDKWNFYTEKTNLTHGIYTYQGFAIDGAVNKNNTEMRTLTINNPPTHSTPVMTTTGGTNFTNEDLTCNSQSTDDLDGDLVINIIRWYKNEAEESQLKNQSTISSSNTQVGENWKCSVTPFDSIEYGITKFSNDMTITCVDSDEDEVCDNEEAVECIGENVDNLPVDTLCADWELTNGCHDKDNLHTAGYVVGSENCVWHEYWDERWPDGCYNFTDMDITCGSDGEVIDGSCDYEYVCEYDPDISQADCAANFSKGIEEVICYNFGDTGCWDIRIASDPFEDTSCCGDDTIESKGYDECWSDDTNKSGCCEGIYITDPDLDGIFCNKVGEELNKRSVGDTADCDETGEEYCYASSLGSCQDVNCYCCGDDKNETWSVFTSGEKLEEVIIGGSCENGKWVKREEVTSTLYDLWTSITS